MLIIEGPDMVGKSTFIKALLARLLAVAPKSPVPALDHFTHLDRDMTPEKYSRRFKPWCISDRGHLSNLVYGSVCRGEYELSPEVYRVVDGLMLAAGGMMVVINATPDWYAEIVKTKQSARERWDGSQNLQVAEAFRQVCDSRFTPFVGYRPMIDLVWVASQGQYPGNDGALVDKVLNRYLDLQAAL